MSLSKSNTVPEMATPDAARVAEKLIAALTASGKMRGRISFKTIEACIGGQRASLRFLTKLMDECEQRHHPLVELQRGGFAMIAASSLEGAPSIRVEDETPYEHH